LVPIVTLNSAQSQELLNLRDKTGLFAQFCLVTRLIAAFVKLRWIVESTALGAPLSHEAKMLGNVINQSDSNSGGLFFSSDVGFRVGYLASK